MEANEAVTAYDAVVGVKVMLVAALAVVANDVLTGVLAFEANEAVTAYDAVVGVKVILVAALAVVANDADVLEDCD